MNRVKCFRRKIFSVLLMVALVLSVFAVFVPHVKFAYATEIFSDDFEDGTLDAWDAEVTSGAPSDVSINSTDPYAGNYCAKYLVDGGDEHKAYLNKSITEQTSANASCYMKFDTILEDDSDTFQILQLYGTSSLGGLEVREAAGSLYWQLRYRDSASSQTDYSYSDSNPTNETWYHIKLNVTIGNGDGVVEAYVDDVLIYNKTGLTNNDVGNIAALRLGVTWLNSDIDVIFYVDNVVADEYIGEESISGSVTDLTYPYNATKQNTVTSLKAKFTTNGELHYYWWEHDFADGINMVNQTAKPFSDHWGNDTFTLPNSIDTFHAKCYGNTTTGIETVTSTISITTTENYVHYMETFTVALAQIEVDAAEAVDVNGTIYFPEGVFEWNVGDTLPRLNVTTNISLFGAPTERDENDQVVEWRTIFNMTEEVPTPDSPSSTKSWIRYTFNQTAGSYNTFRVSDIKLIGYRFYNTSSTTMYTGISVSHSDWILNATAGLTDFRVDHCHFQDMAGYAIALFGGEDQSSERVMNGVIDHNIFANSYGNPGFLDQYEYRTLCYGISMRRWASYVWEENSYDAWGDYNNYTIVIEDNYFEKWRHATCSNDGIHQIVRFNTFNASYGIGEIDGHGSYATEGYEWAVGTRILESYNNTFSNALTTWTPDPFAINVRGGAGLLYNNTIVDGTYDLTDLNNDWGNYEPCRPDNFINDTHIWDNTLNGGDIINYNADSVLDVNYYLRAPSMELDGYTYTPYIYPHPLVSGESATYYYLNVTAGTGGTTDPTAGEHAYLDGSYAVVEAFPEAGCSFANWTLDAGDGGTDNPTSVMMTANHTIQPNFVVNQTEAYTYSIDFTNQKVYVQLVYNGTSDPAPSEACSYAGGSDTTNSTGWAEFDLTSLSDFSYNTTAYPTTYPANNLTVPIAKGTLTIQALNVSNTISSVSYSNNVFSWSVSGSGVSVTRIYCTSNVYQLKIDGVIHSEGDQWSKTGNIITITDTLSSHSYEMTLTQLSTWSLPEDDFIINLLEGDFLQFIFAMFTITMGEFFYIMIAAFIFVPIYIRTQSVTLPSILWIIMGSLILVAMPLISPIAVLILVFGIAGVIWSLYTSSRS